MKRYENYKDSGVEWLGEVPSHWDVQRSKFIFKKIERKVNEEDQIVTCFRDGQVTLRANRRTEGFTNALKEHGYQGIRKGDLVIHAMDAFAGAIGISDSDGKATPVYSVCLPHNKQKIDVYFYAYYLRNLALSGFISSLAKGIRERSTDFRYADFAELLLPIPPYLEQQKIAQFLDDKTAKIDQAVNLAEKQIALLKEHKQILIQNAVTRGLNPDVPLKDSGVEWIGQVPEHWEVKQIKYLTKIYRGKFGHRPRNDPALYGGIYPFVQTGDVARANKYITNYTQTLNEKGIKVSQLFPQGALLMAIAANIGDVAILDFEAYAPDSIVGFTPNKEISLKFLYYCFITLAEELKRSAIQNTQANLNIERIGSIKSVYPNIEEQCQITNYLDIKIGKIDQTIELKTAHIEKLKEYKSVLINDVVTGKVRV